MIRKFTKNDSEQVMKIWLETNIEAHSFDPQEYWRNSYAKVKEMLPEAQIFVFEDEKTKELLGFIGLMKNYIAGIFIVQAGQSQGIGKALMDYVKKKYTSLTLTVYQKNSRALAFYQRENFSIQAESTDNGTKEKEFIMSWKRGESK